jgi:hypothetical protein
MASTLFSIKWFPSKGVNNSQPKHMVGFDMATGGQDFVIEENTICKKRDGFTSVNATAVSASPTINSLFSLRLSNGTIHEVLGTDNGGIWEEDSGVVTASIFSGLSTSRPTEYTQFLDNLILADGTNVLKTWDGSSTANISAAATGAKFVETHLNKLFIAGMSSATDRVDYSTTGDYNTWTGSGTDAFQVEQNDGQDITGIKSYARNELIIFKDRSTHKLIGYDKPSFNLLSVDKTIGCVCSRTIQNFKSSTGGGLLIWAYIDGIYVYDGSSIEKISSYVQETWDTVNATRYTSMDSTLDIDKGRYLITFSTGSSVTNDTMFAIDLLHPWRDDNGLHFPVFPWTVNSQSLHTEIVSSTNKQQLVFGASADGTKNRFGTLFSDAGSSIDSYVISPLFGSEDGLRDSNTLKEVTTAWVSTAGEIDIDTEIKDGSDWITQDTITTTGTAAAIGLDFTIGVSPIGVPEATFTYTSNTKARSRRIMCRIRQNSATRFYNMESPVELYFKNAGKNR